MVAVIAGNGLGLLGTSLQQLGVGLGGQAGLGQSGASQYVNVATGNLVLQNQDADLVVQGFLVGALRTYNSLGSTGDYGTNGSWLLGLDRSLSSLPGTYNTPGSTVTRTDSDGSTELFTYDTNRGVYVATNESGAEDTLAWNAGSSTWTYTAGGSLDEETYNVSGTLTGLTNGETGAGYTLSYTGGKLTTVAADDNSGQKLELVYDAQGRISTLSAYGIQPGGGAVVTESRISYTYDDLNRLTSVTTDLTPDNPTDDSVFTTTYGYDQDSTRIASLTQSEMSANEELVASLTVSYTYDSSNRVASVTTGAGADAQILRFTYSNGTTTVTDASGQAWVYAYDGNGNLTSVTSPLNQVTSYTYTPDGHLASITDPSNNETIYEYDAHGNLTLQRDADGNTTTWTYNTDDQVLTRTVYRTPDPDGSDPANAGAASDPSTTWYVYDDGNDGFGKKDQLRYVIDADGNVSETQYNANGQVSMTRSFAAATYDTSALDPDMAPSLSAMNTWLSLQQDLSQTTRVDYAYDTAGRLSQKTAWDEVNSSGNGIADAGESITTYVYDAQGLLRQQVTERGADRTIQDTTSYSYDGMGRLTGSTDAAGNTTTYVYTGGGTLAVTYANGLVHTEVRNSAGELVTVTESASDGSTRTTHYYYDEDGQLRATEDPSGAVTYTFYDPAGRISGTVDATGEVTQYTRDADGDVVETRQYATTVDTTGWLTDGSVTSMPSDMAGITGLAISGSDRVTYSLYDAAGLHVADVDAEGNVTTYGYDGAGNQTVVTQYATALSSDQLNALQETPSWSILQGDLDSITSAADRITRTFYDVANRAVATLDASGYLTTTAYDAGGRVVKTTAYATGLTSTQLSGLGDAPALQTILDDIQNNGDPNLDNPANAVTRNYYDDRGQLIAQVDADGYLTTTTYDETTHTATSTRYAVAITATLTGQETLADLVSDVGTSTSQTSAQQYDADGRLSISTAVDGTTTQYGYDFAGNLTSTTTTPPSGAGAQRSTSATYDVFGDELTSTDGAGATTTYTYNALGQPILATDALGNNTWSFYDADGRLAYTVRGIANGTTPNALGEFTAYAYDAFGDVTHKTVYATRLDLTSLGLTTTTSLSVLGTAVAAIANAAVDDTQTYTYTLAGQIATALHGSVQSGSSYVPAYTNAYGYDAFGDLTSVMQQLSQAGQPLSAGNSTTTTYTYDARGERTGEVDDVGGLNRTTGVSYDAFGRVVSRTDGNGNVTTYTYDPLGRQVTSSQTVDGVARTTQTTYDAYGRIVTETDALGNVTTYQYSADTHSVTVTTPLGVKLTTTRDAYGDTVSVTDSLNNTTSYTYDGDGRLLTTTDALGNISSDSWDLDGNLLTSTDADGVVTTYTYDAAGRMLSKTLDPTGNNFVTTYTWDARGQQLSVTDPGKVVTTYTYDADGNVLTMVKAAGEGDFTTTYTWDGAGHQLTMLEGAGTSTTRTTQYTYDNLGRLTQTVVDPGHLNLTTSYVYDANNNLIAQTDADGNTTYRGYNEANQVEYVVSPAGSTTAKQGAVTRNGYDADGQLTSTTAYATLVNTSSLGAAPSLTQLADLATPSADDRTTYTVYNNDGEVGYTIDAEGYVTLTQYDSNGREMEVLAYANALSASTLASLQTLLQQGTQDAQGTQVTAYDAVASAVSAANNTEQNAQATLYLRDADGQVRFVVKQDTVNGQRLGMVSEQRYDADGRVIASIDYGTPLVLNDSTDWLYDQLSTSSVAQTLSGTTNVRATYDVYSNVGTLSFVIDPDGYVTQNNYDYSGNLTSVHRWLTAITLPATLTTHNVSTAVQAANASDNCQLTVYVYDRASRLIQVQDNLLGVSDLTANATYTYDALGQKTSYTDRDNATWNYHYDAAGRLVEEDSPQVAVSSYTSGNTISTANASIATQYTYDGDGNVLSRTEAAGTSAARTTTYTYDRVGNQTSIIYPSATYVNAAGQTVTGTTTASITYDAFGDAVVNQDVDGHYEYKVYNTAGELAYDVDGNGHVTAYTYDAYGNQTQIKRYATAINFGDIGGTWAAGKPITLEAMQKQGVLTANANQTDGDRTITTTYDQLDRKVQVAQSEIAFVSDAGVAGGAKASPTTTYTYDAYGNVTSTSVLLVPGIPGDYAPTWATTYDYYNASGQKTLEVDPMGYVTTWAYDARGNVTSTTQYANAISTSGLNPATPPALPAAGNAATGFDRTTTYTYDAIGRKASETDTGDISTLSGNSQTIGTGSSVTTWTYDGENRITSVTSNGATTTTTYDALGRVISVLQPARKILLSNWQALLEANPTKDLSWSSLYETSSPLTLITYDALGDALRTTTSTAGAAGGSQVSYSHYDALGRVTGETDADGTAYSNVYDASGNLLQTSYMLEGSTVTTTNTYDADNQRLSSVTQRGSTTESATYVKYNAFGEIVAKGDGSTAYSATGYELTYQYDDAGNLVSATDPKTGAQHAYQYDLRGNLVYDTTPVTGGGTAYVENRYDLDGRVTSQITPSSTSATGEATTAVTHTYDRWGNVLSTTDARGYTTTYEYDSQNHLIHEVEPQVLVTAADGTRTVRAPTKAWSYGLKGNLTGVVDENGNVTTNVYDGAGELTSSTDALGAVTYYAYDGLGNQAAKQTPIDGTTSHITWQSFDALGQVIAQGDFTLNGSTLVKNTQQIYVLDANGNRTQVTDALGNTSYYSYDSQGRLLSSQTPDQHAASKTDSYTYDVNGNKTGETTADNDHETWTYDYYGRVRTHTDLSGATYTYTYDANSGLLTKETSTWSSGETDPTYVPSQDKGSGSTTLYAYYADGQVKSVTQQTGITSPVTATTSTYAYDANGNETDETVQTWDGAGDAVDTDTQTSYDSHNRLLEINVVNPGNGAIQSREVYNYDAAGNRRAVFTQSAFDGSAISASPGNPTASAIATQTVQPNTWWSFNASSTFSDPLGFGLTYTASNLPSWMHITSAGQLYGQSPTPNQSWTVTVTGTDALGRSVSANVTVTVPVVNPVFQGSTTNQTWKVGTTHSYTVPGATDPNGSAITYAATYYNGTSWTTQLPAGITFNASTRTFSGTPPTGSQGSYYLAVTAYAANGGHSAEAFTLNVTATATAPVYNGGIGEINFMAGTSSNDWKMPTNAFSSTDGGSLVYTITKRDGSALLSGFQMNPSTGELTATISSRTNDQDILVTITATDSVTGLATSVNTDIYVTANNPSRNSVEAQTQTQTQTTTPNVQAEWFTYDADNRVDVEGGSLVSGQIQIADSAGSVEKEYDEAGDVVTQLSSDGAGGTQAQTFSYDVRGEQTGSVLTGGQVETKQYDADGHLIADVYTYAPGTKVTVTNADGTFQMNIGGWLSEATTYYYDADGQIHSSYSYGRPNATQSYWNSIWNKIDQGTLDPSTESAIPASPPSESAAAGGAAYGVLTLESHVSHWDPNTGTGGYDADGNTLVYTYSVVGGDTTTYRVSYLKQDGYLEKVTSGTSSNPNVEATTDTSYYDNFGRRIDIATVSAGTITDGRAFAYDAEGQIIYEVEGKPNSAGTGITPTNGYFQDYYTYASGQQVAHLDAQGTIDVLSGVTGFSNSATGTTSYVVQDGDTLASIAQQVYGDSSLWYVVADANGLQSDSDLVAGQTLKLPEVTTSSNTSTTFKPYNPSQISGSTTPTLPQAPQPAPSGHNCNTLAEIVVVAVVIVASIYTAGAAAEALSAEAAADASASTVAIGTSAVTVSGASTFAVGAEALAGSYGFGVAVAAGAVGGAIGNAAGQLVGDAEGIHQGFSLGETLSAGIAGGITAGVGAELQEAGIAGAEGGAIRGAAGYAGQTIGNKITGQPDHFSWANLVADTVGSAITAKVGLPTNTQLQEGASSGNFLEDLGGSLVNGAIDSETARLLGGNAANGNQIAIDAFGNALGNAAIAGIERENAISEQHQARSDSSLLSADNPDSQVNPVAAYLSGPYADTGEYADALADYNPLNGPLLASSDAASTYAGVYGPVGGDHTRVASDGELEQSQADIDRLQAQGEDTTTAQQALDELWTRTYVGDSSYSASAGYSLTADQAAAIGSIQNQAPWLNPGEWSSDTWQTYIGTGGDVFAMGNPVYDANGVPVTEGGVQVYDAPGSTVTPSAAELAQLQNEVQPTLGAGDYIGTGLSTYSWLTGVAMEKAGVETLSKFGVEYGISGVIRDLPAAVGGVIGIAQAVQAYNSGSLEEADMAAGATLGGVIGGDAGFALGEAANVIIPGAGLVFGPVFGIAGSLVGSLIGAESGKLLYRFEYPSSSTINPKPLPIPPNRQD